MPRSFFSDAIDPDAFLREEPPTFIIRGSADAGERVLVCCDFLTGIPLN